MKEQSVKKLKENETQSPEGSRRGGTLCKFRMISYPELVGECCQPETTRLEGGEC